MKKISFVLSVLMLALFVSCGKKADKAATENASEATETTPEAGLSAAREKALTISCTSNLKQIGLGLAMYAMDYDDKYPAANGWEKLLIAYIGDEKALKCPKDMHQYRYIGGGQKNTKIEGPESTIVVFCECDHQGKTNVCFADGHVASVDSEQVEKAIQTTEQGDLPKLK